jgi:hypothetical protein
MDAEKWQVPSRVCPIRKAEGSFDKSGQGQRTMTFTFPKSALPDKPTLLQRMNRDMAASEQRAKLRSLYRKARESEKAEADRIRQVWRAEAEAEQAELKAMEQEVEAERQEEQAALLASLPDEPPPPECDAETLAWYDSLKDLLSDEDE